MKYSFIVANYSLQMKTIVDSLDGRKMKIIEVTTQDTLIDGHNEN